MCEGTSVMMEAFSDQISLKLPGILIWLTHGSHFMTVFILTSLPHYVNQDRVSFACVLSSNQMAVWQFS